MWRSNQRAWVTQDLFKESLFKIYALSIKDYLDTNDLPLKALLLLDSVPGHRKDLKDNLLTNFSWLTVLCLPPNTTLLIPPMDQEPNVSTSVPSITTSSSSSQALLLPSTCSIAATVSEPQPPIPVSDAMLSTTNNVFTPIESPSIVSASPFKSGVQTPSVSTSVQDSKQNSKTCARNRKKRLLKKINETKIEIKMATHKPRKSTTQQVSSDEEMIEYDSDEYILKYMVLRNIPT
ncbi:DDE-1 domain-containing protein [Trichonephila clavipes]|nr:DDE-1 domain-containing protein [Trichonephila clavipes]